MNEPYKRCRGKRERYNLGVCFTYLLCYCNSFSPSVFRSTESPRHHHQLEHPREHHNRWKDFLCFYSKFILPTRCSACPNVPNCFSSSWEAIHLRERHSTFVRGIPPLWEAFHLCERHSTFMRGIPPSWEAFDLRERHSVFKIGIPPLWEAFHLRERNSTLVRGIPPSW